MVQPSEVKETFFIQFLCCVVHFECDIKFIEIETRRK